MINEKNLPGNKTVNRHSKYSKYVTVQSGDVLNWFQFDISKVKFPERDVSLFKLMTLNLNYFPKSLWSQSILSAVLLHSQPDIVFLQEIKHFHKLNELITIVNQKLFPCNYHLFYGIPSINNLNTGILYNSNSLKPLMKKNLFANDHFANNVFSRVPLITKFKILSQYVYFINLHLISHASKNYAARLENCLIYLREYFRNANIIDPVFIGGDWNIDSHSGILEKYFPDFHLKISNFHHKSDYFLLLNNLLYSDELEPFLQYEMPVCRLFDLSQIKYKKHLSDHKPVILELPVSVFK